MNIKLNGMIVGLVCLFMVNGCALFSSTAGLPWSQAESEDEADDVIPEPVNPIRMTTLWTDTVLSQHGQKPIRGFGGRIMFFDRESRASEEPPMPVVVDGTLTVYVFADDDYHKGMPNKPEKRYVFTPEQLFSHRSKSDVGHSYSVWIPWDEVGGPQRRLSLIARFEPTLGGAIMSDPRRKVLPGLIPETELAEQPAETAQRIPEKKPTAQPENHSAVAHAVETDHQPQSAGVETAVMTQPQSSGIIRIDHEEDAPNQRPSHEDITTATIDVPSGFVHQIVSSPISEAEVARQAELNQLGRIDVPQTTTPPTESQEPAKKSAETNESSAQESDRAEAEDFLKRDSQSGRFVRERFRVRNQQLSPPTDGPIRRKPFPATWPSDLPQTPRSPQTDETSPTTLNVQQ